LIELVFQKSFKFEDVNKSSRQTNLGGGSDALNVFFKNGLASVK